MVHVDSSKPQARKDCSRERCAQNTERIFTRQQRGFEQSNKNRISDQWQKLKLRFPRTVVGESFGEVSNVRRRTLDPSETAAGSLAPVFAVDLTEQFVTTSGNQIVRALRRPALIADEE